MLEVLCREKKCCFSVEILLLPGIHHYRNNYGQTVKLGRIFKFFTIPSKKFNIKRNYYSNIKLDIKSCGVKRMRIVYDV